MSFDELVSMRLSACHRILVDDKKATISLVQKLLPTTFVAGSRVRLLIGSGDDANLIRLQICGDKEGYKLYKSGRGDTLIIKVSRWPDLVPNKRVLLILREPVDKQGESLVFKLPDIAKAQDYVPKRHKPPRQESPQRGVATKLPTEPVRAPSSASMTGRR